MREDDKALHAAAMAVMAGRITREQYVALHDAVMEARKAELPDPPQPECGHPWSQSRRVWENGEPTDIIVCWACVNAGEQRAID